MVAVEWSEKLNITHESVDSVCLYFYERNAIRRAFSTVKEISQKMQSNIDVDEKCDRFQE